MYDILTEPQNTDDLHWNLKFEAPTSCAVYTFFLSPLNFCINVDTRISRWNFSLPKLTINSISELKKPG